MLRLNRAPRAAPAPGAPRAHSCDWPKGRGRAGARTGGSGRDQGGDGGRAGVGSCVLLRPPEAVGAIRGVGRGEPPPRAAPSLRRAAAAAGGVALAPGVGLRQAEGWLLAPAPCRCVAQQTPMGLGAGAGKHSVCLSEMRAHLKTCEKYIEKYGPVQELGDAVTRYSCPYCQCEVAENELMDHCLSYHRWEGRAVCCPICYLTPGRDPSYFSRNFIRHLRLVHTLHFEDYIDINSVGEVLVERVLGGSFLEYVRVNHPNST
ncbi:E3 ubiquitin-protein ligase RNF125 [Guaruba guarouba]